MCASPMILHRKNAPFHLSTIEEQSKFRVTLLVKWETKLFIKLLLQ